MHGQPHIRFTEMWFATRPYSAIEICNMPSAGLAILQSYNFMWKFVFWFTINPKLRLIYCTVLVVDLLKVPNSDDRGRFFRLARVEVPPWHDRSAAFSWWSVNAAGCNMGFGEILDDDGDVSFNRTKYNYAFRKGWSWSLHSLTESLQPMNYTILCLLDRASLW